MIATMNFGISPVEMRRINTLEQMQDHETETAKTGGEVFAETFNGILNAQNTLDQNKAKKSEELTLKEKPEKSDCSEDTQEKASVNEDQVCMFWPSGCAEFTQLPIQSSVKAGKMLTERIQPEAAEKTTPFSMEPEGEIAMLPQGGLSMASEGELFMVPEGVSSMPPDKEPTMVPEGVSSMPPDKELSMVPEGKMDLTQGKQSVSSVPEGVFVLSMEKTSESIEKSAVQPEGSTDAAYHGKIEEKTSQVGLKPFIDRVSSSEKTILSQTADIKNQNINAVQKTPAEEITVAIEKSASTQSGAAETSVGKDSKTQVLTKAEPSPIKGKDDSSQGIQNPFAVLKAEKNDITQDIKQTDASKTAEEPQVISQVLDKVSEALEQRNTEFKMKLNPEGLGEIKVTLVCDGKKISLDIVTSVASTQKLLEDHSGVLRATLADKNYDLIGLNVGADTAGASQNQLPFSSLAQGEGQKHDARQNGFYDQNQKNTEFDFSDKTEMTLSSGFFLGRLNCRA